LYLVVYVVCMAGQSVSHSGVGVTTVTIAYFPWLTVRTSCGSVAKVLDIHSPNLGSVPTGAHTGSVYYIQEVCLTKFASMNQKKSYM